MAEQRISDRLWPALAAITLANLGLLLVWSLVVPTFRAPDEHVHHDFLRHLTTTWSYPEYDGLDVSRRTLDALGTSPAYPADHAAVPREAATHRSDRPSWEELGPDVRNGPPNQMPMHPPLYYESTAAALRVLDGDGTVPLDRAVWQLRLLNVLAMAPLPLIAADVARRFTRSSAVVVSAAAGVLAVPQLTHIGASVSNDPLMIVLGSLALAGAARLVTGDRRWVTAVATGVFAGLALFTKGFAVPIAPAVALACLLPLVPRARGVGPAESAGPVARAMAPPAHGSAGDGERPTAPTPDAAPVHAGRWPPTRLLLLQAVVVAALALAFGGWWWIRNAVEYGTPQPGVRLRERVPGVERDLLRFAGDFSERIVTSFWGNFGWFEARLPLGVSAVLTAGVIIAVGAACWRSWPRLVLLLPPVVATAMVLSSGWGAFKKTGVSYATQGRYLFTGIVGISVLVALGAARLARRRTRWQPTVTLGVALVLQAGALWIVLHRYWAGSDALERARAMIAFAPVPGSITAALLAGSATAGAAALALVLVRARRPAIPK